MAPFAAPLRVSPIALRATHRDGAPPAPLGGSRSSAPVPEFALWFRGSRGAPEGRGFGLPVTCVGRAGTPLGRLLLEAPTSLHVQPQRGRPGPAKRSQDRERRLAPRPPGPPLPAHARDTPPSEQPRRPAPPPAWGGAKRPDRPSRSGPLRLRGAFNHFPAGSPPLTWHPGSWQVWRLPAAPSERKAPVGDRAGSRQQSGGPAGRRVRGRGKPAYGELRARLGL